MLERCQDYLTLIFFEKEGEEDECNTTSRQKPDAFSELLFQNCKRLQQAVHIIPGCCYESSMLFCGLLFLPIGRFERWIFRFREWRREFAFYYNIY